MDKNLTSAISYIVYFEPENPNEIHIRITDELAFTGKEFLDALQDFIEDMRPNEDTMLKQDFVPSCEAH